RSRPVHPQANVWRARHPSLVRRSPPEVRAPRSATGWEEKPGHSRPGGAPVHFYAAHAAGPVELPASASASVSATPPKPKVQERTTVSGSSSTSTPGGAARLATVTGP